MESIINEYKSKYPRVAEYVENLNPTYPMKLKMEMCVRVSVLMAKLDRGDFNEFLIDKNKKLPNEVIDMFGRTYLQNYSKLADAVYEMMGNYDTFPKINVLDPDNFVKKLINQVNQF